MRAWLLGVGGLLVAGAIWLLASAGDAPPARPPARADPDRGTRAPALAVRPAASDADAAGQDAWTDLLARLGSSEVPREGEQLFDEVMRRHRAMPLTLEELLELALLPARDPHGPAGTWARILLTERREEMVPHLPRVLRLLNAEDEAQRAAAALTIGLFAPLDAAHVPLMVAAMERTPVDYAVGRDLIRAMGGMGVETRPLAPHLIRFVEEIFHARTASERVFAGSVSWDHVEYDIAECLAVLGPDAIPPLLAALERQIAARTQAAEASGGIASFGMWDPVSWSVRTLRGLGADAVPTLLGLLRHEDAEVRSDAAGALENLALVRADIRRVLEEDLRAPDALTRSQAARVLGTQGEAAVAALQRTLTDEDHEVRTRAAVSLAVLGVASDAALAPLLEVVKGPDMFAALDAARTLARWGSEAAPALSVLTRAFRGDAWHDAHLSRLLAGLACDVPKALHDAWAEGTPVVRAGLAQTIGCLEDVDPTLLDLLERAVQREDVATRVHAAAALARHGRRTHLRVLAEGLESDVDGVAAAAAMGLAYYGADARALLPRLVVRLTPPICLAWSDEDMAAFTEAVATIGAFDLAFMQPLLVHESIPVKVAALYAFQRAGLRGLAWIAQAWQEATPALRGEMLDVAVGLLRTEGVADDLRAEAWRQVAQASTDTAPEIRRSVCFQLPREIARHPEALDLLVARLGDTTPAVAQTAGYLVEKLGVEAAPARAEIERHRNHADPEVQRHVQQVLDRIDK